MSSWSYSWSSSSSSGSQSKTTQKKVCSSQQNITYQTVQYGSGCPTNTTNTIQEGFESMSITESPSSSELKADGFSDFEIESLNVHNELRSKHGVPNLNLSKKLCSYAKEWANNLAARGTMYHRSNSPYGENIYSASSTDPNFTVNGKKPVESWYSEISVHPFGREPSSLDSGHFTQVIWKDSKELGVGMAKSRSGQIFVVANYDPPGNYRGQYVANVPPLGTKTVVVKSEVKPVVSATSTVHTAVQDKPISNLKSDGFSDFEIESLNVHNELRSKHGVPNLNLSKKLCSYAKEWADNLAARGTMYHRSNSPYGENIYSASSSDPNFTVNGRKPVESWYSEISVHPFGREPSSLDSGHFTQVVWRGSKEVGVGMAKSRSGQIFVVANYDPPGNYRGQYVANVPPKCC